MHVHHCRIVLVRISLEYHGDGCDGRIGNRTAIGSYRLIMISRTGSPVSDVFETGLILLVYPHNPGFEVVCRV